jgi:hypothetical protein
MRARATRERFGSLARPWGGWLRVQTFSIAGSVVRALGRRTANRYRRQFRQDRCITNHRAQRCALNGRTFFARC